MSVLVEDRDAGLVAHPVRWWESLAAHVFSHSLDTALAAGQHPESSPALAVRAQWLTTRQVRDDLAASLEGLAAEAVGERERRERMVPVQWRAIAAHRDAVDALVAALRAPGPVAARGMALTHLLLTDGGGPLYDPRRSRSLGSVVDAARRSLPPTVDL